MPSNRPNAFEVSFPEEAKTSNSTARSTSLKRTSDSLGLGENREVKRRQLPPVAFYRELGDVERESVDLVITGEDPFGDDGDGDEGGPQKPVRFLTNFSIFDPQHLNEMISLSSIEEDDGVDRRFEGAGAVLPYFVNEEDEGQEDDDDGGGNGVKYVRLGAILRYTFDYTQDNDPVWIETVFAWYILKMPSREYTPYYQHFYTPRRVAQLVISSSIKRPNKRYDEFLQRFTSTVDAFGRKYQEGHLSDAMQEVQQVLEDDKNLKHLKSTPLIRHLLKKAPPLSPDQIRRARRQVVQFHRNPPPIKSLLGDLDLAVLKPENQTPTHVTPLIASLAQGLIREELVVVGGRPPPQNKALLEAQKKAAYARLCNLVRKAKQRPKRPRVDIRPKEDYVGRKSRYLKTVRINDELYRIGDVIILPIGIVQGRGVQPPGFPDDVGDIKPTATLADYFWFAKILYGDADRKQLHVQWLEHSSNTMLEELGHPQELFYHDHCDHIDFQNVVSKVTVHEVSNNPTINPEDYFVKFTYDPVLATFTSIDTERRDLAARNFPPDNCPVCPLIEQHHEQENDRQLKDQQGVVHGVAYGGNKYHFEDFVLYRAEHTKAAVITIRLVGRISSIPHVLRPNVIMDERHVFLTNQTKTIRIQDLIRVCFVFPYQSIPDLKDWLSMSSDHFYVKYTFPSLEVKSWGDRKSLSCQELLICTPCVDEALKECERMEEFLEYAKRNPLPTLDLFGGVAAFSMGLTEGSGCLQVTDVIEKSPSAAMTTMFNHPDVAVHNQCANVMMRYNIKVKEGHRPEAPKQIFDEARSIPGPIKAAKCLIAGFPCQSHSRLNMYRKAYDIKSNLILNTLSWVDHMRPDLCYFENVPGFLSFSFDAVQAGLYRLEGGTEMSGLKFLVRALGDLGYQVRFGLLQAAHYGTPQRRNRFFLIAAVNGHPLPELPQPTHDFPEAYGSTIKLPVDGSVIRPIRSDNGTAPHPCVTIENAISDLPRFDWKHPNLRRELPAKRRQFREREREIPTFLCKDSSALVHCGFRGDVEYHHAPRTTYQVAARVMPTTDLQQFTRCFPPRKVERVVSIPLIANADYRDLRPDQQEWQTANPLSAVARNNYRPGLYGRLDKDACFPTTVTNMEPTAKQSKVLNPWCKRMVTVRELARSQGFPDHFVFKARNDNVVTMHRQIGNAVPLQVGAALGRELRAALYKKWLKERQEAIVVDD